MWLLRFFSSVISKSSSLLYKNFELIFAALYFYIYELKSVSQIFKTLFQTGGINIFVLRRVFFSRYVLTKKTSAVKSETQFSGEAIEN